MKNKFKNRMNSDRADTTSVSNILWMAFAVLIIISIGAVILNALTSKSKVIEDCINASGLSVNASEKCNATK